MEYDASLLIEFAVEAREHIESVEDSLLKLAIQKGNHDKEVIDRVFRSVHSIKGGAGFLSLKQMAKLAHAMEALLSEFRATDKAIGNESIDALIAGVDLIQLMLDNTDRSNDIDISSVHERLTHLLTEINSSQPLQQDQDSPPLPQIAQDIVFDVDPISLDRLPRTHSFLYFLKYDLHALWEKDKKSPVQLIKDLLGTGIIADSRLENCSDNQHLIYKVFYASILDKDMIAFAVGLSDDCIMPTDREKFQKHVPFINLEINPAHEMTDQYVSEAEELLERIEHCLFDIAEKPEHISEAFRLIHSLKGNSGLLGFADFERLSHQMETVLEGLREGCIVWNEPLKNQMLRGTDAFREALSSMSETGIARIKNCDEITESLTKAVSKEEILNTGSTEGYKISEKVRTRRNDLRVDLEKLDLLINLVGELVITESMVSRNPDLEALPKSDNFERAAHTLRRVISDLQDVALSMRMVPLSRTFRKMVRLVHDLSLKSGKKIRLELIGEETEVDKTVIEHITDPLVHIIRNCADHGIEFSEERRKAGKPETGLITISGYHEGGEVAIEISDDGRGLNREKIFKKASAAGLISGDLSLMSDDMVHRLIFEPGFTTAEAVSDVSGRGVGMDVVRRNLEKIKGRIELQTIAGKGTTLFLRIPLTLAIIEGMLIRVGSARYTIPLLSIREAFRPGPGKITVTPDGQEIVRIRNDLISVLRLHEWYKVKPDQTQLHQGILIHVASGMKSLCLFADEIVGHHHTVIKGIPEYISSARGISGFTILDNGEVSLILDVGGIIEASERGE